MMIGILYILYIVQCLSSCIAYFSNFNFKYAMCGIILDLLHGHYLKVTFFLNFSYKTTCYLFLQSIQLTGRQSYLHSQMINSSQPNSQTTTSNSKPSQPFEPCRPLSIKIKYKPIFWLSVNWRFLEAYSTTTLNTL